MPDLDYDFLSPRPAPPPAPPPPPVPTPPPDAAARIQADLLKAHNDARRAKGLGALTLNDLLIKSATAHSQDCADRGRLSHDGSDGSSPFQRMQRAGYRYTWAAENIAWNQQSVAEVMAAWMGSSGHRANILGVHYQDVGFGYVEDRRGGAWWTANFAATAAHECAAAAPFERYDADFAASAYRSP